MVRIKIILWPLLRWRRGVREVVQALALAAIVLLVAGRGAAGSAPRSAVAAATTSTRPQRVYVTSANYDGSAAPTACSSGYHMAGLWEIADLSAIRYAYDHPDAHIQLDSGYGAPSNWWGWVRTGGDPSATNAAGQANCNAWTTAESGTYGTLVRINAVWTSASTTISPWQAQTWSCAGIAPVWCAEDTVTLSRVFLPLTLRF